MLLRPNFRNQPVCQGSIGRELEPGESGYRQPERNLPLPVGDREEHWSARAKIAS
jgi:hypothetical protein